MNPPTRTRRRWTLGGLMVLIALLALPLALYMQHVRRIEREQVLIRLLTDKLEAAIKRENIKAESSIIQIDVSDQERWPDGQ